MARQRESRGRFIVAFSHLSIIAGIYFALSMWGKLLADFVHNPVFMFPFGDVPIIIRLFYWSPIPGRLAIYLTVTVLLIVASERLVANSTGLNPFLKVYPMAIFFCFGIALAFSVYVWVSQYYDSFIRDPNLYGPFFSIVSAISVFFLGLCALVLYRAYNRLAYLVAFAVVPLVPAILSYAYYREFMHRFWYSYMRPDFFLSIDPIFFAAVILVAFVLIYGFCIWRSDRRPILHTGTISLGIWSWAVLFVELRWFICPYLLMGVRMFEGEISFDEGAVRATSIIFYAIWAGIILFQILRYFHRKRRNKPTGIAAVIAEWREDLKPIEIDRDSAIKNRDKDMPM